MVRTERAMAAQKADTTLKPINLAVAKLS